MLHLSSQKTHSGSRRLSPPAAARRAKISRVAWARSHTCSNGAVQRYQGQRGGRAIVEEAVFEEKTERGGEEGRWRWREAKRSSHWK